MQGGLLLDVVVAQGATVLELLACKDQTLLVGRDPGRKLGTAVAIKQHVQQTLPCPGSLP